MTLETNQQQGQLVRWAGNQEPPAKKRKAPDESDEAQKRLRIQPPFPAISEPQEVTLGPAMQKPRDEQGSDGDIEMGEAPEMEGDAVSNIQLAVGLGSNRGFLNDQSSNSIGLGATSPFSNRRQSSLGSHDHRAAGNDSTEFNNRQLAPCQRLETIEESSSHSSEVSQYQAPRLAAPGTLAVVINQRRAVQDNFSAMGSVTSRTRNERTFTSRQYNPGGYDEVTERTVTESEGEFLAGVSQSGQFVASSNLLPSRSQQPSLQHGHSSPGFHGSLSMAGDLNDYLRFLAERGGQRRNGF
ncbi:hypothetical protein S40285_09999 [Stachybotrys chlorohalonatus IBT 40285]|uniref:Uncharacterized protein n=1 Tax=Stachybotrys chlorohalonatus (strain IBT 40285) TaxID=1283841 RepID=A0A084QWL0_STAC4|nr:hypothetical protein S40285_09999 [Stachybotrys chlorohalonata IBT 40285]